MSDSSGYVVIRTDMTGYGWISDLLSRMNRQIGHKGTGMDKEYLKAAIRAYGRKQYNAGQYQAKSDTAPEYAATKTNQDKADELLEWAESDISAIDDMLDKL